MAFTEEGRQVAAFYDGNPEYEWERLTRHPVEEALTRRVILEYGPGSPASIIDIGGGPGRYAIWLAGQGYDVTLLDLSSGNLRVAHERAASVGVHLDQIVSGDATDLAAFEENRFDAALLLGPLYHLKDRADQKRAVAEAVRILKPGGLLFSAFLNRFALVRYAAKFEPDLLARHPDAVEKLLAAGTAYIEEYATAFSSYSYWAHPDEIAPLMAECGVEQVALIGVEGAIAYIEEAVNELPETEREAWFDLNYRLGKEPVLLGSAIHILHVGRI